MPLKIFNIGFNKSGTSSLTEAMKILGYKSAHYRVKNNRIYDIFIENQKNNRPLLYGIEEYNFLSDFENNQKNIFYKSLDKQYPNSKFILTIRDQESWLISRENHVLKNQNNKKYNYDFLVVNKKKWIEERFFFLKEVQEYFKNKPNQLLIINICKGEGWKKLCNFLGKKIPNIKFPYKNKTL
jgi:hypothetical protein